MKRAYIGIDNGVSGSIGMVLLENGVLCPEVFYQPIPTFKGLNYTKKKASLARVDRGRLRSTIEWWLKKVSSDSEIVLIERPYVNPKGFKATISGVRALEATLSVIEDLGLPHIYVDSREWQKTLLPSGLKGAAETKRASAEVGIRIFPSIRDIVDSQKDADGILIAEWGRRTGL